MSAGVDDRRLSVMADTFEIKAIALVNMSVTHVLRVILVHYVEESGKARMRQILVVAQIQRGRMRQQDVDAAASPELKAQTADPRTHLLFGILVDAVIIAHGAAQPEDTDAFVSVYGIFDTDAALRRCGGVPVVVVAVDIQNRRGGKAGEKRKIGRSEERR